MNNEKLNYNKPCAPVEGHICIYDEQNNIILETHNNVVLSGRQLLYKLFINAINKTTPKSTDFKINLSYLSDPVETKNNLTYTNINETASDIFSAAINNTNYDSDVNNLSITFNVTINNTSESNITKFNQIYISYNTDGVETLFSRAVIDPVYLGASASYTLKYTLYF